MTSVIQPPTVRKGVMKTPLRVSPSRTRERNTKKKIGFTGINNIRQIPEAPNENRSKEVSLLELEPQNTKNEPIIGYDMYKAVRNHYVTKKYNEYFSNLNDEEKKQMNTKRVAEIKSPFNDEFDRLSDSEKTIYRISYAAETIEKQKAKPHKKTRTINIDGKNNNPITQSFYIYGMPQSFFSDNNDTFNILNISELFMGEYLALLGKDKIIQEQFKNSENIKYGVLRKDILRQLVTKIYTQINNNQDISQLDSNYTQLLEIEPTEYKKIGNQIVPDKQFLPDELIINNYISLTISACLDKQDYMPEYKGDNYFFYAYNPEAFYRTTDQVYEIFKYSNNNTDFTKEIFESLFHTITNYDILKTEELKIYHVKKIALFYTEFILRLKYMLSNNKNGNEIVNALFIATNSPVVKLLNYFKKLPREFNLTKLDNKFLHIQPVYIIYHLLIKFDIIDAITLRKVYETIIQYIAYSNLFYGPDYIEYINFIMSTNNITIDFDMHKLFAPEDAYNYTFEYISPIISKLNTIANSKIIFLDIAS